MPYKQAVGAIKLETGRALNVSESRIRTSGKQVCTSTIQILAVWDVAE